jgi:hypothetical protein
MVYEVYQGRFFLQIFLHLVLREKDPVPFNQ